MAATYDACNELRVATNATGSVARMVRPFTLSGGATVVAGMAGPNSAFQALGERAVFLSGSLSQGTVRNRLLAALPAQDYQHLEPNLVRVPLALGQILIEAHEPIDYLYFPLSGLISTVTDASGHGVEVGLIGREGFASTAVVLGADRSPHTSMVQGAGEALRIRSTHLQAALSESPSLFRPFGLYVQSFITQMAQTIFANAAFNIEARLARWILMAHDRSDGDELPVTHEFLATMLGVRRPGVTVASHILEGDGMIRNRRGRIIVLDRGKLIDLAGESYQVAETEYERLAATG